MMIYDYDDDDTEVEQATHGNVMESAQERRDDDADDDDDGDDCGCLLYTSPSPRD